LTSPVILAEIPYLARQVSTFYGRHRYLGVPRVVDLYCRGSAKAVNQW
jgi:hypothetical protein